MLFGGGRTRGEPLGTSRRNDHQNVFRSDRQRRQQEEQRQVAPRKNVVRAAPAKISAPSYYTYKADALRRVDFAPLAAIGQSASLDPASASEFREAVSGLVGYELFAETEAGKAIIDYYTANPDFIWVSGNDINDRGREALRVLGEASSYGLSPVDYGLSVPSSTVTALDEVSREQELIRFEMALSARVLRYVSDADERSCRSRPHLRILRPAAQAARFRAPN